MKLSSSSLLSQLNKMVNSIAFQCLLASFNRIQNLLVPIILYSIITIPIAVGLFNETNRTTTIQSSSYLPSSIFKMPPLLLIPQLSTISLHSSTLSSQEQSLKSIAISSPTHLPSDQIDRNLTFDVGQLSILIEAVAFFVIGCLSLFQVRILLGSQKSLVPNDATTASTWPHRLSNARSLVNSSSTLAVSSTRPVSLTGGKTRALFIALLCLSNFVRSISLVLMALWVGPSSTDSTHLKDDFAPSDVCEWDFYLLQSFPALLFLSTYSVVVLFWAQVYYATLLVSVPLLRPAFIFLNLAVLLVFIIMAALTRSLGAYVQFRNYTLCFVGGLHLLIGAMFVYFGIQVAAQFAHQGKGSKARDSIIRRVVFLSVVCPLIFALRGAMSLCFVFKIIESYHPVILSRLSWDALVFLVTELVPVILILASFWSTGRPSNQDRSSGSSVQTDIQAPLLDGQLLGELRASLGDLPSDSYRYNNQNLQIADALYDSEFRVRPPNFLGEGHSYGTYNDPRAISQQYHGYGYRSWDISRPQQPDPWDTSEGSHYKDMGDYMQPPLLYDSTFRSPPDSTADPRISYGEFQGTCQYRVQPDYNEVTKQHQYTYQDIPGAANVDVMRVPTTDTTVGSAWNNFHSPLDPESKHPHSIASSSSSAKRTAQTWCISNYRQSQDDSMNNNFPRNLDEKNHRDRKKNRGNVAKPRSRQQSHRFYHNESEGEGKHQRRDHIHNIMSAPTRERRSK